MATRSKASVAIATFQPPSTAPTTASSGRKTSSRKTSLNSASPSMCASGRTVTPSLSIGSRKYVIPRCRSPPPVRASRMACAASCARLVQIFCPEIRQPPSARSALVRRDARSDPESGSEKSWHQISSPVRIGRR
jgi:hypothetical protein